MADVWTKESPVDCVGNKIKELRIKRGLMQKELGHMLSVSNSTISHWENGRRLPSISELRRISVFFDVDLNYFQDIDWVSLKNHDEDHEDHVTTRLLVRRPGVPLDRMPVILFVAGGSMLMGTAFIGQLWSYVLFVMGLFLTLVSVISFVLNARKWRARTTMSLRIPPDKTVVFRTPDKPDVFMRWRWMFGLWLSVSPLADMAIYGAVALACMVRGDDVEALLVSALGLVSVTLCMFRYQLLKEHPGFSMRFDHRMSHPGDGFNPLMASFLADFGVMAFMIGFLLFSRLIDIQGGTFPISISGLVLITTSSYLMMVTYLAYMSKYQIKVFDPVEA